MKGGWKIKPLGEVAQIIAGQSPNGSFYNSNQIGLPFYQGKKEFQETYIGPAQVWTSEITKQATAGDILISIRAPVGPVNFATELCCIGRGLAIIRASNQIDKKFLFYLLRFKEAEISGREGAVFASINKTEIAAFEIPLPPLPEQKRVVAILDETFAGIAAATANAEKNLANARELFEATLSNILISNSKSWSHYRLQEMVETDCTLSYGIVQPGEEIADGLPIVRPTDLSRHIIDRDGLKRIDPALAQGYSRTTLLGGELLLCVRGNTGGISIASSELAGGNVTRGIVPIRFSPHIVSQKLGYYLFLSRHVQDQIRAATYGTALMQINIRDLRQLTFVVPPPEHQPALLRKLEHIAMNTEHLKKIYKQKLTELTDLKQVILQKAFSGELTALSDKRLHEEVA